MTLVKLIKKSVWRGLILISLSAGTAQAANLLQNGSFENTAGSFVDNGLGWMSLDPGSNVIPGWKTTTAELLWGQNVNIDNITTPFGSFLLDFTGYHNSFPYGGVTQTINTTVGQQYTLSLSLGTYQSNPVYIGPVSVEATAGSSNQTFTFNPSGSGSQWSSFSFDFTATSTSTPISIVGTFSGGCCHIGLDNVSVEAKTTQTVPEPSTILGLGVLGFGAFCHRQLSQEKKSKQDD
jgi:hypothetical protein